MMVLSNTLIWFRCLKKNNSLMEDKRIRKVQREYTHQNSKKYFQPVSLILCHKIVAVRCFVWSIALPVNEWVSEWVSKWVSAADRILIF